MIEIEPIQVTDEGVLIPLQYLPGSGEYELVLSESYVLIRAKPSAQPAQKSWLSDLVGIAETNDPTASTRVEEILADEIDRRAGWTLDPYTDSDT
jgi:hypothetical protein